MTTTRLSALGALKHPGGVNVLFGDGSVRFGHDLPDIVASIKSVQDGISNTVIIVESTRPGWRPLDAGGPNGIIAILIGLLLPAVQKVREAASRSKQSGDPYHACLNSLQSKLGPGTEIYVMSKDGQLVPYL